MHNIRGVRLLPSRRVLPLATDSSRDPAAEQSHLQFWLSTSVVEFQFSYSGFTSVDLEWETPVTR
jgi:hypothetical protein